MKTGFSGRIAQTFINSKLTPLLIAGFLAIGLFATYLTPSEEEPQIVVPMADVFVQYPGAEPKEIETKVIQPLEKIISNIRGVEYVYSTSMQDQGMLIVRFVVGEDAERAIIRLYDEVFKNMDKMPAGVRPPFIKSKSVDDVPIFTMTLWSARYDALDLRRFATELSSEYKKINDVSEVKIIGGRSRQVRVILDKEKMAAYRLDPLTIIPYFQSAHQQGPAGKFNQGNTEYLVQTGNFLETADDVRQLVVGAHLGKPVYLKNIAQVEDGPDEIKDYVTFGYGAAHAGENKALEYPAVTLSVSKRKGSDAMGLGERLMEKSEALKGKLIPSDVTMTVTRNYGETASEKVHELLKHLSAAILAVTVLVAMTMGWRSGLVIFMTVPVTFAMTLFVYYMFGYTLNRITLFALVFVTGLVVDDAIIVVENMHRHFKMRKLPFLQAAIASIDEVGNPTILATFTVIASVLPMAFVSGLMGPYMSPMPIGASLAMLFSLLVALVITPYLAYRLLRGDKHGHSEKEYRLEETGIYKLYTRIFVPLLENSRKRWWFIGSVVVLLLASMSLMYFKLVTVKMLPFDNKNELQVVIDMPEGATLEKTTALSKEIAAYLRTVPEVVHYQMYTGTSAPINFNGLVRHYDLRQGSNVADIQVNFLPKGERSEQSHDIAKRIRPEIVKIGASYGARIKIAEVPPGPPVLSTLVAEVYGPDYAKQMEVAHQVRSAFESSPGVVDVDWLVEDDQTEYRFEIDKEKAAQSGVSPQQIYHVLGIALNGKQIGSLYQAKELEPVSIQLQLAESQRSSIEDLKKIHVMAMTGTPVALSDLVRIYPQTREKSIYRKNQQRVVYVTGDVAGEVESPVYAILNIDEAMKKIELPEGYTMQSLYAKQPFLEENFSTKWDGEWQITYEVFRDLGAAFAAVIVIIYFLIIGWFQSFKVPFVMMVAIPLSLVGILVGHWMMGAFFTATSMIGMIALAGVMVRNSVLLIDFIELRLQDGVPLKKAIIESGAVRTTPILLTSGAVVIGAFVILFDPIFQGLAISLIGGAIASTALTLIMVPLFYYMTEKAQYEAAIVPQGRYVEGNSGKRNEGGMI